MKKISVIGVGKLGLCLSLNLENNGFDVLGVDINENYVKSLNNKTFFSLEPKVNFLLDKSKNFKSTTDINLSVQHSDIIFLMVSTPSLENGKYDHSQVEDVILQLEKLGKQNERKILVIGCTTYPGYCETLIERLDKLNFSIVYNPEFIAQGNIINGQIYPDIVLIGESDKDSGKKIECIHKSICLSNPKIFRLSLTEAELTKLSINCFITTKISFANMIGDLCNNLKINHINVLNAIGSDTRIGEKYLKWGYGFGGPCFPRDNRALGILCEENGIKAKIPKASDDYNNLHAIYQTNFIYSNLVKNNIIKIEGVSYKPDSILIDESQQLKVANMLNDLGVNVTIVDNLHVINEVKKINGTKFKYEEKN
jgi:UDPglucose 6-dehydrogenase